MNSRGFNLLPTIWVIVFLSFAIGQNVVAQSSSDWTWPLDGGIILTLGQHSTTLENTDYYVKNLDLVNCIWAEWLAS